MEVQPTDQEILFHFRIDVEDLAEARQSIGMAEELFASRTGVSVEVVKTENEGVIPRAIVSWLLIYGAEFYRHREATTDKGVHRLEHVDHLIERYIRYAP